MKLNEANDACNQINNLDIGYLADVEEKDGDFHVAVRHALSGNEIAFAETVEEIK